MKIGFIGLGIMGESMCENIVKKHDDTVYCFDFVKEKVDLLASKGAVPCENSLELAKKSDVIVSMVPKSEHSRAVYTSILEALDSSKTCIDMSTIDPSVSVEISEMVKKTGMMNVNCLSTEAPFSVFQHFGFQSGRDVDKFADCTPLRSDNGLIFLPKQINAFMSLKVEQFVDLDTHGMFICTVTEARVLSDKETMTYNYYQANVKPKPDTGVKKGWVCKICGYVYEGENLPEDFICPLCKHGAADFEPLS